MDLNHHHLHHHNPHGIDIDDDEPLETILSIETTSSGGGSDNGDDSIHTSPTGTESSGSSSSTSSPAEGGGTTPTIMTTNAMLVSSPYKLLSPPSESSWDPWRAAAVKNDLTACLWDALRDLDLNDVCLVARDGEEIPASRFVLAARSPVLKRMLYGSFREAKATHIPMRGYEKAVLQGICDYCTTNQLPTLEPVHDLEFGVRQHVRLYQAADFLELQGLQDLVHLEIRRLTGLYPGLACAVLDEVEDTSSRVGEYARLMMEVRPYVSLGAGTKALATAPSPTSLNLQHGAASPSPQKVVDLDEDCNDHMGGVECLRPERLQAILKSPNLMCGELFLFQMLRQWYDYKIGVLGEQYGRDNDDVNDNNQDEEYDAKASQLLEDALECAKCLYMENIEPAALLQIVQPCPFVHPTFLFDAFAKQALRASQNRVWTLHSRPLKYQAVERVLVEDCGSRHVRGMYVRMVSGLKKTHGTIYTKREVVSGQAVVYTLSCSVNAARQVVECRLFCSPLLTPQAVPTLYQYHANNNATMDPTFQPILQIVALKRSGGNATAAVNGKVSFRSGAGNNNNGTTTSVVVSDGHHCLQGTLANNMAIHNSKEVQLYGILQVLAFRLYSSSKGSGEPRIYIQRVSIVNSDAGQVFGRPSFGNSSNSNTNTNSGSPTKFTYGGGSVKDSSSGSSSVSHLSHPTSSATTDDDAESHVPESVADESVTDLHNTSSDTTLGDDANSTVAFEKHHHAAVKDLRHVTVLYSCSYPLQSQNGSKHSRGSGEARDARIPRLGWQVEDAGQDPPPTCTWFPAVQKSNALSNAAASAASSVISGLSLQSFSNYNNNNNSTAAAPPAQRGIAKTNSSATNDSYLTNGSSSAASAGHAAATQSKKNLESLLREGSGDISADDNDEVVIDTGTDYASPTRRSTGTHPEELYEEDDDDGSSSGDEDDDDASALSGIQLATSSSSLASDSHYSTNHNNNKAPPVMVTEL